MATDRIRVLAELERKILWLATWTVHHANHLRPNPDGLKVGGHQASSASMATIMTALYLAVLRPQDRVAVKPHASPAFHAIQYLLGRQTREKLEHFRGLGGAQSYPSRTKDTDDVDFSTGSVGLGVAQTLFSSLVQDYVRAKGWGVGPEGRMVALLGDAEMDEGNIFEALAEGWKHGLRNTWWVVDYNRQSLDAVVREGLWSRLEATFRNFGWDVVVLRHGTLQRAAFAEPGGERLRAWIEACPNQLYSALTFQGGAAWRRRLLDDLGDQGEVSNLIARRSDEALAELMGNLGGHDLPTLLEALETAARHDRPTCFIAYTIKGAGLPLAGHKDNHAGLLTPAQLEGFRATMRVREGHEWDLFEGLELPEAELRAFLTTIPFAQPAARRHEVPAISVPASLGVPAQPVMSTQQGFGLLMHEIAKGDTELARRIVTTSPDVTVSTNLGAWVNRRGLYAREEMADIFRRERIPSTFNWQASPGGQHMELGIAEMNLFLMLSALGLSHSVNGARLLPVGTLYDPFIERGLDALNYACYQDARFITVATPSGVTLAPEGGAHQSIKTPLIGLSQDGLASFEPAFVDELAVMLRFALEQMQRHGTPAPDDLLRDAAGGAAYLRLSTRSIEQPQRRMDAQLEADILAGGYWLRRPGPNAELVVAYAGAIAPEAIAATGMLAEDRRDVGLLAVTSADRLHAGWLAAQRRRDEGNHGARSHAEHLLAPLPRHCGLVTVLDGHPATLAWLGGVEGHRTRALGVERFGQTGTIADLYRINGIDAEGIAAAAQTVTPGRPVRHLRRAS
ncbi:transketolase [Roseomonas sp. SSH11]|uniref:Pyruvate dehydrogenase E1 component n=1 Tax=Pararoseomonas baculiformis TaxID=2820812 RepID=A0ABS4A9J7_9PROT|nr:transketolase [Pararoseomonas baculiformis]MBP0443671.1 transketolase [Pararoseomonas baculiformis]